RRLIVATSAAVFAIVLAILFGRFDVDRHHSTIQAEMERQLDRKVTLGKMRLGLLPVRLYVKDPVIWDDPNFRGQVPFIKADSMVLSLRLLPLLEGHFEVDAVDWRQPQVELIKNSRGEW